MEGMDAAAQAHRAAREGCLRRMALWAAIQRNPWPLIRSCRTDTLFCVAHACICVCMRVYMHVCEHARAPCGWVCARACVCTVCDFICARTSMRLCMHVRFGVLVTLSRRPPWLCVHLVCMQDIVQCDVAIALLVVEGFRLLAFFVHKILNPPPRKKVSAGRPTPGLTNPRPGGASNHRASLGTDLRAGRGQGIASHLFFFLHSPGFTRRFHILE